MIDIVGCVLRKMTLAIRGAGSNVKRQGQPFQKGTSFFWAAIFAKTLLYGYSITCGYYGSANLYINFEQFYSLHRAKGAK
jgi:hypothetical protein